MSDSPWGTPRSHHREAGRNDDIEYEIKGQELQFVEIELDPGESAIAEAGAMVWKDATVTMTTVFGSGGGQDGGFMGKLLSAGKRIVTGESLFTTVFTHTGSGKARVAFGAPVPGAILPIRLARWLEHYPGLAQGSLWKPLIRALPGGAAEAGASILEELRATADPRVPAAVTNPSS